MHRLLPPIKPAFQRAALDRNMTVNTAPVKRALRDLDLSGLSILDFGCGNGNILRLLKDTAADTIYAFEVMPQYIDPDILAWAGDPLARPRLVINPEDFRINQDAPEGDLTNYDYFRMLADARFAIVSNPPYFLYNRILSLTGTNLAPEDNAFSFFRDKFAGALMITSAGRLHNHPGWVVRGTLAPDDFDPPAGNVQYLIQTGFEGRYPAPSNVQVLNAGKPQRYVAINNRDDKADLTDHYPEMWGQLENLKKGP